jgi:GlcNAc-P-P-Und epimerase
MENIRYNSCVLIGGNGFIGSHFASYLLEQNLVDKITIADAAPITPDLWPKPLQRAFAEGNIEYAKIDVREPFGKQSEYKKLPAHPDLIVNLAAVHKEPGHKAEEYFLTNLPGAENVCAWAEQVHCDRIIFTSSIATYGGDSGTKDESTLTMPNTPYGISKLTAEKIHLAWQMAKAGRKLMIVRPGVIFGPTERGNVTRMVRAVSRGYFFFSGNKDVRKAGGYVKELCRSMLFMLKWQEQTNTGIALFNFTMDPAPSMQEYADGINKVMNLKRKVKNVPYRLLLTGSYFVHFLNKLMGRKQSISPTTVKKTLKYNSIDPKVLRDLGYTYEYSLEQGLADWYKERPQDW